MTQPGLSPTVYLQRAVALPVYARTDLAYTKTVVNGTAAVGGAWRHDVVGGQLEIIQQVTTTWVTSAVVGDRFAGIQFHDPRGNVIGQAYMPGPQPASTTYNYTWMLDPGGAYVQNTFGIAALPFLYLYENCYMQMVVVNADAGDLETGQTHTEVVIPTGPPLSTAPPSIASSPVIV